MSLHRVLVTGAGGQLGAEVAAAFEGRGASSGPGHPAGRAGPAWDVLGLHRDLLDVSDRDAVLQATAAFAPDVVVHAAAWTAVDECEADPARAFRVNALGTRNVAEGAERVGAHLCAISTDYVFDGRSARPYTEWDEPRPLSVYGRSKLGGERECPPGATVIRTSWLCGSTGPSLVSTVLGRAQRGQRLAFVDDQRGSPTFAADLAAVLRRLAVDRRPGLFHVTNQGEATWYSFARAVVAAAGYDPELVQPITTAELDPPRPAPRPAYSVLDNAALSASGLPLLADWQEAVGPFVKELLSR